MDFLYPESAESSQSSYEEQNYYLNSIPTRDALGNHSTNKNVFISEYKPEYTASRAYDDSLYFSPSTSDTTDDSDSLFVDPKVTTINPIALQSFSLLSGSSSPVSELDFGLLPASNGQSQSTSGSRWKASEQDISIFGLLDSTLDSTLPISLTPSVIPHVGAMKPTPMPLYGYGALDFKSFKGNHAKDGNYTVTRCNSVVRQIAPLPRRSRSGVTPLTIQQLSSSDELRGDINPTEVCVAPKRKRSTSSRNTSSTKRSRKAADTADSDDHPDPSSESRKSLPRKSWKCPFTGCPRVCKAPGDLKRHLESASHKEPSYYCAQCDSHYTRIDALKRHQRGKRHLP